MKIVLVIEPLRPFQPVIDTWTALALWFNNRFRNPLADADYVRRDVLRAANLRQRGNCMLDLLIIVAVLALLAMGWQGISFNDLMEYL